MAPIKLGWRLVRADNPPWWMTPLIPILILVFTFHPDFRVNPVGRRQPLPGLLLPAD